MKYTTIVAHRASIILYNVLMTHDFKNPFLIPANICPIVPLIFLKTGVRFKFIDIDKSHLCLNQTEVEDAFRARNGAIGGVLVVHTYGTEKLDLDFYRKLKLKYPQTFLIDDRCLQIPQFEMNTDFF